jgi:hypothetical protein
MTVNVVLASWLTLLKRIDYFIIVVTATVASVEIRLVMKLIPILTSSQDVHLGEAV